MNGSQPMCACGRPLHYTRPDIKAMVERFIAEMGEYTTITITGLGSYRVQRHYIALHGFTAADRHLFEQI